MILNFGQKCRHGDSPCGDIPGKNVAKGTVPLATKLIYSVKSAVE